MTLFPEPFTNLCNFWKKQKTAVVGRQFFKNNEKMRKILKQVCVLLATALLGVSVSCGQFDVGDFQTSFGEFTEEDVISISNSDISVHFLQLGNQFTGDCTLIKTGDQEILIDAGSRKGSAETIVPYIEQFCEDGVLEYVVATHAHQDHIAGFVGTEKAKGVFESFVCETIIDYPKANTTSKIRSEYEALRDQEVAEGAVHYTALECLKNENVGLFEIADGITMQILYQRFYEDKASSENDYSVCLLITAGEDHFLFTGDLEEKGEKSLVENNVLPKCVLYKAGHHGSKTSNTETLLSVIQPEIVCVCCCCGSDEYTDAVENMFPTQAFVDRIALYTDKVYVTTVVANNADGFAPMNGTIVVESNDGTFSLRCSNNAILFKDSVWFQENRTCPIAGLG